MAASLHLDMGEGGELHMTEAAIVPNEDGSFTVTPVEGSSVTRRFRTSDGQEVSWTFFVPVLTYPALTADFAELGHTLATEGGLW